MKLRRGHHRKVIARVVVQRDKVHQHQPEADGAPVAAHHQRPQQHRHQIGQQVLRRVAVDGGDGDRSLPVVVHLVHVPVEAAPVQQPVQVVEAGFLD